MFIPGVKINWKIGDKVSPPAGVQLYLYSVNSHGLTPVAIKVSPAARAITDL